MEMIVQNKHSNFLFILLCSSLILFSCAAIEEFTKTSKPKVEVENIRFAGINFDKIDLTIALKVLNPNPLSVKIAGLDYDFQINKASFLTGHQDKQLAIEAGGESKLEIPLTIGFKQLYDTFQSLTNKDSSDYKIISTVYFDLPVLGRTPITISKSGNLPLIKFPSLNIASLKLKNVSFSGANLELNLKVKNPNAFSLYLNRFNYDFAINGLSWIIGKTEQQTEIIKKKEANLKIPISLNFLTMGQAVYQLLQGDKNLNYQLNSDVNLKTSIPLMGEITLPMNKSGQINITR